MNTPARRAGFTMVEMLVVLVIIAILALMAVPSFQDQIVRDQINNALPLADIAKTPAAAAWAALQIFPSDNASAGLPPADKIVNNAISSVAVQDGAINITFGNRANGIINGKIRITAQTAKEIAAAFETSAELWMNLQKSYDLFTAPDADPAIHKRAAQVA